jgi:hypothetical protein
LNPNRSTRDRQPSVAVIDVDSAEEVLRVSRRKILVARAILILVVVAGRLVWGPIRTLAPVGACLPTGQGIDLDNPFPYRRAAFSGTVVGLAASGGGSRAAYFEAAVLRENPRTGPALWIGTTPPCASFLEQLDINSSVSGGSLAAGYFTLNSHALTLAPHDGVAWSDFLDKMAVPYRTRQWYGQAAWNPVTWGRSL